MGLFDKLRRRKKEKVPASGAVESTNYSETIVGFVLLERDDCDFDLFIRNMRDEWNIEIEERPEEGNLFFEVNGMQVVCAHIAAPVPDREVEENARLNILWREAEQVTSRHQSQIIVSVLNATNAIEGHVLFTQTASALLQLDHALAIYMAPLSWKPVSMSKPAVGSNMMSCPSRSGFSSDYFKMPKALQLILTDYVTLEKKRWRLYNRLKP